MNKSAACFNLLVIAVVVVTSAEITPTSASPLVRPMSPSTIVEPPASSLTSPTIQGPGPLRPLVGHPVKADISPALRDIRASLPEEGQTPREIPMFRLPAGAKKPDLPAESDPVLQTRPGLPNMPTPLQSFEGVNNVNGVYPPDTQGDIGYDPATGKKYYVQWVNLSFAIWDVTTGTLGSEVRVYGPVNGNTLWAGFGSPCETTNHGDPITLYDPLAHRWLMSQFSVSGPYYQCIAISASGNPTGAWYRYAFLASNTLMNDYPKFGVWPDAYYMSANMYGATSAVAFPFAFNRTKMLAGDPTAEMVYFDLSGISPTYFSMLPADLDGDNPPPVGAPNYFAEVDDSSVIGPADALRLWKFQVDWTTPANSTFGISGQPNAVLPVASFTPLCLSTRNCIPQPGTAQNLDAIGDRLMYRLQYRNFGDHESLVTNHTVDAGSGRAGVRWYEVRDPGGSPAIYQQGTYAPADTEHRWMGSVAMDHVGNLALGYSVSSGSVYPSIRYTGRLSADPLGTLPQGETEIIAGSGSQTGSAARWGDYSMMGVDPTDDCTFWYTQEYIQATGLVSWRTRIASFRFSNCAQGPHGTLGGTVVNASTFVPIASAQVQATSSSAQTYNTTTGADGTYAMALPTSNYTVTASAYSYQPGIATGVSVISGTTTTLNIALTPVLMSSVYGTVEDAVAGWPLYAHIIILGDPFNPPAPYNDLWTDPVTGYYSVTLAGGITYTFNVNAWVPGYNSASRSVGPLTGNRTENITLTVYAATCNAPGYSGGLTETFDLVTPPTLPVGWATQDITGTAGDWATNAGTHYPSGQSAHSAPNLAYFNSFSVGTGTSTRLYRTSGVNMTKLPASTLSFWMYHDTGYSGVNDRVQVQISTDGGATWTDVGAPISRYDGSTGWNQHTVSLSAYTSATDLRLGLLGISAYGNDIHIDDIVLGDTPCVPEAGGLVVGNTYDANASAPLIGATVSNDSGRSMVSAATADPAVPDSFYTLFSPSGSHTFTATKSGGYGADVITPTVVQSSTVRQDLYLPAGQLSYAPSGLQATLAMGANTTKPFTLTNNGGLPVSWELIELSRGVQPLGPFESPNLVVKPFKQDHVTAQGLDLPNSPSAPPYAAGDVIRSWPSGLAKAWGIAYDKGGAVWVSSPAASWGGNDRVYEYTPAGTQTGRSWPHTSPHASGPADLAFNWNTGMLWSMNTNTGIANCIYEIDPASGYTGNSICPGGGSGFAVSQRGLAYDPSTDTWYAGSWNDGMIHHFDSTGVLLDEKSVGLAISGLAYNPDTQHLFVMVNASSTLVYVLDAANQYAVLGQFSVSGPVAAYSGAGLEMDCDGNLWATDQTTQRVYQFQSGEATTVCTRDVPWLSESPISGTIPLSTVTALGYAPAAVTSLGRAGAAAQEVVGAQAPASGYTPSAIGLASKPYAPTAVLFDNGPQATHPGSGAGGADASAVQSALGMSTYGFGHAVSTGYRVADDLVVTGGGWQVDRVTFYAYQTGALTSTSTITSVNLRIWNGVPGAPGSQVVWGDTTTNRLTNTTWSHIYRVLDTSLADTYRPIMANTVAIGKALPPGHYWLDWQTDGTLASGPWASPITLLGRTMTGNAMQYDPVGGAWSNLVDVGPQGLPFIVEGSKLRRDQSVQVTFDAGVPQVNQPGIYRAQLMLKHNTPYIVANVPVTMTVTPPASWGKLNGTVTGLARCDAAGLPLNNATVLLQSSTGVTWTQTTDTSGQYLWWMDQTSSPLSMTVSRAGYITQTVTGIAVTAQQTTTQNVALRPIMPCVTATPAGLSAAVASGQSVTVPLALVNSGAGPANWALWEKGNLPAAPIAVAIYSHSLTSDISYWFGGNANAWSLYQDILTSDVESRFAVTVVTDLSPATLAGFDRLLLPDNAVPDVYTTSVASWFTPGKRIIAVDSATTYAAYSGFMWPASAGSNGYGVYWDYNSGDNDQEVLHFDRITRDYVVGQVLNSYGGDAELFAAGLPTETLRLTANRSDHSNVYVASRGVPGKGTIVVLGPYSPFVASDLYTLVRNAVEGGTATDIPWLVEQPVSSTVGADTASPIAVTFIALPGMVGGDTYTATLAINTGDAGNLRVNVPVTMTVVSPAVCGFTSSSPDDVGQTTVFTNTSTGTGPMSYSWNFGDGTPISSAAHPTHPYAKVGLYTVVLTATNSWDVSVCSGPVGIEGLPSASFVSNSPVVVGQPVIFTNTTLAYPPVLVWVWNLGDGTLVTSQTPPPHVYASAGNYAVVLTAVNAKGTNAFTATVQVASLAPSIGFTFTPSKPLMGQTVSFSATVSGGTPPFTYTWTFGDGSATQTGNPVSHSFPLSNAPQTYTVRLTVNDANGPVVMEHPVTIWPRTVYLPIVIK